MYNCSQGRHNEEVPPTSDPWIRGFPPEVVVGGVESHLKNALMKETMICVIIAGYGRLPQQGFHLELLHKILPVHRTIHLQALNLGHIDLGDEDKCTIGMLSPRPPLQN
jgi:hypothetical protein